jgi:HEAT repeat protein
VESALTQNKAEEDVALVHNIINTLLILQSHLSLYSPGNRNLDLTASKLFHFFDQYSAAGHRLTLHIARHGFLYKDDFVDRKNPNFIKFAHRLFQHGIAELTLEEDLSPGDIQAFLMLINRKPAETWDEGGIAASLAARDIGQIVVREMSDDDFPLDRNAGVLEEDLLFKGRSRLWEKFVLSVQQTLQHDDMGNEITEATQPHTLAEVANQALAAQTARDQATFARDASRFLLTIKHEPVAEYRTAALQRLSAFVNRLTPALRKMFLSNAFNLNVQPEMIEPFLENLSDEIVLQALQDVAGQSNYTPPFITKLLRKLAQNRNLEFDESALDTDAELQARAGKIRDLFKPDDFKKYVPDSYQNTLLNILQRDTLPIETLQNIAALKQTLEEDMLEDHLGTVLGDILRHPPAPEAVDGLAGQLVAMLDRYVNRHLFCKVVQLCRRSLASAAARQQFARVLRHLGSQPFTESVLDATDKLNKAKLDEALELIRFIKKPFIVPILERLAIETNRRQRMFYLTCLKEIGPTCRDEVLVRLDHRHWYVTRNMVYLLRELGDPTVLPHVRSYLDHEHPRVSQEALKTCLIFKDQSAAERLLPQLDASDPNVVRSAIVLAGLCPQGAVLKKLLELAGDTSLAADLLSIRKAAIKTLALTAPREALPVLAEILNARSLLQTQKLNELKMVVLSALVRYPTPDVIELVRAQTHTKAADLARHASMILSNLERV